MYLVCKVIKPMLSKPGDHAHVHIWCHMWKVHLMTFQLQLVSVRIHVKSPRWCAQDLYLGAVLLGTIFHASKANCKVKQCTPKNKQDWSKIAQLLNHKTNAFQILSTLLGYGLPLAHQIPKNLQRSDPNLLVSEQVVDSWASCTPKWSQLATHHSDAFDVFRSLVFHWVFLSQEAKIDEHISHPAQLKLEASEIMRTR